MGEHKGWRVREDPRTGRWVGQVRRPGGYRSRTFDTSAQARAWAKGEAALAVTGRPSAVLTTGGCLVSVARKDYLADLLARRRSPSHIRNVERTLTALQAAAPDLAAHDAGMRIERWLNAWQGAPAGRNKALVEVRGLVHWLQRRDRLDKDPTRAIERAAVDERLRPQLTIAELRRCLFHTHWDCPRGDGPKADPYHLLFAVLAYTGMRFQEGAMLRWQDIDWAAGIVTVSLDTGAAVKRRRERIVPLQPELRMLLDAWRRREGRLFQGREHNPSRGFRAFLERAGVTPAGRSAHSLRHSFAGLLTATGVPTALVGAYLGHTSAATTMLYTKLAARYAMEVAGWPRGELAILAGATSPCRPAVT